METQHSALFYIIIIGQYLLFALLQWYYVKLAHSKNGRWSNIEPELIDVILVLIPIVNILFFIIGVLFAFPIRKSDNQKIKINHKVMNQFFNIKK